MATNQINGTAWSQNLQNGGSVELMSGGDYNLVVLICLPFTVLISIAGVVTNVLNVLGFLKLGLRESVSLMFFYLSIFDFLAVSTNLVHMASLIASICENNFGYRFNTDPFVVAMYSGFLRNCFYLLSVLETTFLSFARSMCAFRPFTFKSAFTTSKTHVFGVAISTCVAILFIAQAASLSVVDVSKNVNVTRYSVRFTPIYYSVIGVRAMIETVITFSTQGIVLICLGILISSLRKSITFRAGMSAQTSKVVENDSSSSKSQSISAANVKEIQAMQQVSLVSSVYVVCNTPRLVNGCVMLIEPEFGEGQMYANVYYTFAWIRLTFELVNSSINFFVYMKYNAKFSQHISSMSQRSNKMQ